MLIEKMNVKKMWNLSQNFNDGYKLLNTDKKLIIFDSDGACLLDENYQPILKLKTMPIIKLQALCYDGNSKCFWAISDFVDNLLFKLDLNFKIIGRIIFSNPFSIAPNSLCHNYFTDVLYLNFENSIIIISKKGNYINRYETDNKNQQINCYYPKIFLLEQDSSNKNSRLKIISNGGRTIEKHQLPFNNIDSICLKSHCFTKIEFFILSENELSILTLDYSY